MEYRLERRRAVRRAVPVVLAAVVIAGVGIARLSDDPPGANEALQTSATDPPSPALVDVTPETTARAAPTTAAPDPSPTSPPTTSPPSPPTTSPAPPTTVAPAPAAGGTLPEQPTEPVAPPADPRGDEAAVELGRISIPTLDVDEPLLEGIRLTTLDNGPGHWPGTAMPGDVGNVVVAAHRTSHGAAFRDIDQLIAGDTVEFTTAEGLSTYLVTGTQIVEPDAIWIVDPTDTPTATLFACHPPGSVSQRIVVNLELAS